MLTSVKTFATIGGKDPTIYYSVTDFTEFFSNVKLFFTGLYAEVE